MTSASAPKVLAELAQDRLLRAIRPMLQDIADVDWVLQPSLDAAFRAIVELDLAFDLLIRPLHLASSHTLLTRYPELRALVDHCAKPNIARRAWQPWADGMRRIARETSAYCKLSGLVTEARPDWEIEDLRPYVEHVIECFGPQRLVWGSDWPVMTLNADYGRWLDAAQELIAPLSESDRRAVMGLNAMRFYRLDNA
jgi:L-fuconolactonase